MSKIIGHTNFHVASSVNWQEIINSICPLSKVLSIFDMEASRRGAEAQESVSLDKPQLHTAAFN